MRNPAKILVIIPPSTLFPIGWAYVVSLLESKGYDYDVFGFYHDKSLWDNSAWIQKNRSSEGYSSEAVDLADGSSIQQLHDLLILNDYDYILVGGLVGYFKWFYALLPYIKEISSSAKIIIGGGITKDISEELIFQKLPVDYILRGEAETNLLELIDILDTGSAPEELLAEVPGLCFEDSSGGIQKNTIRRFDIANQYILPAWTSLNGKRFLELSAGFPIPSKSNFPILLGRGCTNACAFCSPTIGTFKPANQDYVFDEMKHWLAVYDFDYFSVLSEIAFSDEEQAISFAQRYKEEIGIPWVGQLRTDVEFSKGTYKLLAESKCRLINYGFESANDSILKVMRKNTTVANHLRNISQANEAGLTVCGSFILGHKGEDASQMLETFEFIRRNNLLINPSIGINALVTYPGTEYFTYAQDLGQASSTFKFLLKYNNRSGICGINFRNSTIGARINLSSLPDDEFYDLLARENIRTQQWYRQQHLLNEQQVNFNFENEFGYEFSGKCNHCGSDIHIKPAREESFLNFIGTCDNCYYCSFASIFAIPEFSNYLAVIKKATCSYKRILVVGNSLMSFLFNGDLEIDYDRIVAWRSSTADSSPEESYFYSKEQLSASALSESGVDAVLLLEPFNDIHSSFKIEPDIPVITAYPQTYNPYVLREIENKNVAVVGSTDNSMLLDTVKEKTHRCTNYASIDELNDSLSHHDFVLFFADTIITREKISQLIEYRVSEIFTIDTIINGGLFSRNYP